MDFLSLYDSLDIIGNGSFGVIRKVRRKSDGLLFARKELYFERMNERDRRQVVAEVNILKNLKHDHIVRYHDRYVDRDAGILYILMEYCGGGDLSSIINQSLKDDRLIPEETIWNYLMQILLALNHCHGHGRARSLDADGKEKRAQILHRDLKPDNVFLDENNIIKLGDFGLAKALTQSNLAFTCVGTPYYMSPELMQEKAYDSKSDIWSLGCLIYELCALKPPFHEAETYPELNLCIRNGRIPPLPRGYSQSLWAVIKSMLSLNPAMRPSAAQLLQHERVELAFRVFEAEKLASVAKNHELDVAVREKELFLWETSLIERESRINTLLAEKDAKVASLVSRLEQQTQRDNDVVEQRVKDEISKRDKKLRVAIMKCEDEVAETMARREQMILDVARRREEEFLEICKTREEEMRCEMIETMKEREGWIKNQAVELGQLAHALDEIRKELEVKFEMMDGSFTTPKRKQRPSMKDIHNILTPLARTTSLHENVIPISMQYLLHPLEPPQDSIPSASESSLIRPISATPELVKVSTKPPMVDLNLRKILDCDLAAEYDKAHQPPGPSVGEESASHPESASTPPPNPSRLSPSPQSSVSDSSGDASPLSISSKTFGSNTSTSTSAHSDSESDSRCRLLSRPSFVQINSTIPSCAASSPTTTVYDDIAALLDRISKGEVLLSRDIQRPRYTTTPSNGMLLAVVAANVPVGSVA